jgi:predicted N-acetyltransferase YhbS
MDVVIREAREADAAACGRICREAFNAINAQHNFPPDFPNDETAIGWLTIMLRNGGFYGVVAELEGQIAGSNFLDERSSIAGVGPITVDPKVQDRGVGRGLMQAVMERSEQRGFAGICLVQAGFHSRSLSLYTELGFDTREHLCCIEGAAINATIPGCWVRAAKDEDVDACNRLCLRVHGQHRGRELRDAIRQGVAMLVERGGESRVMRRGSRSLGTL